MMINNLGLGIYAMVMVLASTSVMWWINKQLQKTVTNKFKIDTMVVVEVKPGLTMIGQVVEIKKEVALIKFYDNMHYHANLSQLKLLSESGRAKEEQ